MKLKEASDCFKRVLETAKLDYANEIKKSVTSQKLDSSDFWRIANSILHEGKSTISPLFNSSKMLSSSSDTVQSFSENFFNTSDLDYSGSSCFLF